MIILMSSAEYSRAITLSVLVLGPISASTITVLSVGPVPKHYWRGMEAIEVRCPEFAIHCQGMPSWWGCHTDFANIVKGGGAPRFL